MYIAIQQIYLGLLFSKVSKQRKTECTKYMTNTRRGRRLCGLRQDALPEFKSHHPKKCWCWWWKKQVSKSEPLAYRLPDLSQSWCFCMQCVHIHHATRFQVCHSRSKYKYSNPMLSCQNFNTAFCVDFIVTTAKTHAHTTTDACSFDVLMQKNDTQTWVKDAPFVMLPHKVQRVKSVLSQDRANANLLQKANLMCAEWTFYKSIQKYAVISNLCMAMKLKPTLQQIMSMIINKTNVQVCTSIQHTALCVCCTLTRTNVRINLGKEAKCLFTIDWCLCLEYH